MDMVVTSEKHQATQVCSEIQGKMHRLNRLIEISFSTKDGLTASFNGHTMCDGGGGSIHFQGGIFCRQFGKSVPS